MARGRTRRGWLALLRSILLEALQLLREVCSTECLREECIKLKNTVNILAEILGSTKRLEPYMLKTALNTLISFLEAMTVDAFGRGCGREAMLLLEATARLKALP